MNCCDRLLVIFVVFSFFQYQLRWSRDEIKANLPWSIVLNGSTKLVSDQSSAAVQWVKVTSHGIMRVNVTNGNIVVLDRYEDVFVDVSVRLVAPPRSHHIISVGRRNLSITVPASGQAFSNMFFVLPLFTEYISGSHRFDTRGDAGGFAGVQLTTRIFHV